MASILRPTVPQCGPVPFRHGVLSQDTYERLAADIDTRLLDLEADSSGDADATVRFEPLPPNSPVR
jgi:hypothetical protein